MVGRRAMITLPMLARVKPQWLLLTAKVLLCPYLNF
jgi:hypothetical protein